MVDYEALCRHLDADGDRPFGLVSQQASPTGGILHERFGARLACLFSPEHGWFGLAAAGEKTGHETHPFWGIPVHSLYGETRRPTPAMLAGLGRLVLDLQDIGVRCYTYLATLKLVLGAAAEAHLPVTVLDRPIPLGGPVDGPRLAPEFASFVAPLDVPLCHGMTPGECATFIVRAENLDLDLTVIRLRDWSHADRAPWPNFVPPSPAIRSWDCAALYPATVFTEAFTSVDCDRFGALAFRVLGAPWLDAAGLLGETRDGLAACGIGARTIRYRPGGGAYAGQVLDGLFLTLEQPGLCLPVTAGARLFAAIKRRYPEELAKDARPEWLDKLSGSSELRGALGDPAAFDALLARWRDGCAAYSSQERVDLYRRQGFGS